MRARLRSGSGCSVVGIFVREFGMRRYWSVVGAVVLGAALLCAFTAGCGGEERHPRRDVYVIHDRNGDKHQDGDKHGDHKGQNHDEDHHDNH